MILETRHLKKVKINFFTQLTILQKKTSKRGFEYETFIINVMINKEQYEELSSKWHDLGYNDKSLLYKEENLINNKNNYYLIARQFNKPNIKALNNLNDYKNLPYLDIDITLNENNNYTFFEIQRIELNNNKE